MLVELVMLLLCLLKALTLVGRPCPGTGVRTGRVTHVSMVKPSLSRSQLVMDVLWSPTMWLLPTGLLAKPTLEASSDSANSTTANQKHTSKLSLLPLTLVWLSSLLFSFLIILLYKVYIWYSSINGGFFWNCPPWSLSKWLWFWPFVAVKMHGILY